MDQLRRLFQTVYREAMALLGMLTFSDCEDNLPELEMDSVRDNLNQSGRWESFLTNKDNENIFGNRDDRITWIWRNRFEKNPTRRTAWIRECDGLGWPVFRDGPVHAYGRNVTSFLEKLLFLIHVLGGQPARTREILGIRYRNSRTGGMRNIFVEKGRIAICTIYHKSMVRGGSIKAIWRFLPTIISKLVVYYLWLVRPFWDLVQPRAGRTEIRSDYLWAADPKEDEGYRTEIFKVWPGDRVRSTLASHAKRIIGTGLNVSIWRHISTAILRRFLSQHTGLVRKDKGDIDNNCMEDTDDGSNDDGVDFIGDLQHGTSTSVAGSQYGRELRDGKYAIGIVRDQFEGLSKDWHQVFRFGGHSTKRKQARDVSDQTGGAMRTRHLRFRKMALVSILRTMLGSETATFRGNQERVLRTLQDGFPGVVAQIIGTGEGKSMTFLIPSRAAPDGLTVVVLPLNALMEDLMAKCGKFGIQAVRWDSSWPERVQTATIVFVTPESFITKTFRTAMEAIWEYSRLDRIVLDKYHLALNSFK
jgi:hypothetical protein